MHMHYYQVRTSNYPYLKINSARSAINTTAKQNVWCFGGAVPKHCPRISEVVDHGGPAIQKDNLGIETVS